jgi:hypothetical protein
MTIDTVELLDQLATAVRRDAAQRRRRNRVTLATAVVILVVGAGVGVAGTYDDWWTNNTPAVQAGQLGEAAQENESDGIDLDLSEKATVARTDDAALDAVAANGGKGYCLSLFLDGTKGMGTSCTTVADSEYMTRADDSHWIAYGRILDPGAAVLDLSGVGLGRVPLERGGFYLFDVPRDKWSTLDETHGDVAILDSAGATIRKACVYVGVAPGKEWSGGGNLGDPGGCDEPSPEDFQPELAKAHQVVSLTLTQPFGTFAAGDTMAVWQAPNHLGGVCTFEAPAGAQPTRMGGGQCAGPDEWKGGPPLRVGRETTLAGDHYENLLEGSVEPDAGVAKVAVVAGDGSTSDAAFGGNVFLAELPASPRAGKEPGPVPGGPYRVVAYDAAGKEVASAGIPAR